LTQDLILPRVDTSGSSAVGLAILPPAPQSGTQRGHGGRRDDSKVNAGAADSVSVRMSSARISSNLCSPAPKLRGISRNPFKLRSNARLDALNPALYTSAVLAQTIDLNRRAGAGIISRN
jgi:hypothetical protein